MDCISAYRAAYPDSTLTDAQISAAVHAIDAVCFHRIQQTGFANLTPAQQEAILRAIDEQATFEHDYASIVKSPFYSYSLNGVSMQYGGGYLYTRGAVKCPAGVIAALQPTGLLFAGVD